MPTEILDEAREYLVTFLRGKANRLETRHPWRREWQHMLLHSLRVESYVLRILNGEPHHLMETEHTCLRLAAILHDIGRLEKTENHATTGASIVASWLRNDPPKRLQQVEIERVVELIADHSNKDLREPDFGKAVLKDADILDEIGALSIFMAGNWLDRESPFFFYHLKQRLVDVEIPFCDRQLSRLQTAAAKNILHDRKAFVERFVTQLGDELQTGGDIERLFSTSSKQLIVPDAKEPMTGMIQLRNVTESDLPIFYEHQRDPEATQMASFPARSQDGFMSHWTKLLKDESVLIKTILYDGDIAGNVVCFEQLGEREVGYWLGKKFWGKGIATRALEEFLKEIKTRPLYAHVAKDNVASRRVLEKCGFVVSGEDKFFSQILGDDIEEYILILNAEKP